jgi:hypothetical protein
VQKTYPKWVIRRAWRFIGNNLGTVLVFITSRMNALARARAEPRTAPCSHRPMPRSESSRFLSERFSLRGPLKTQSMSDAILAAGIRAANTLAAGPQQVQEKRAAAAPASMRGAINIG